MHIVLVSMPWATVDVPSLALGILATRVAETMPHANLTTVYANLDFVDWAGEKIGPDGASLVNAMPAGPLPPGRIAAPDYTGCFAAFERSIVRNWSEPRSGVGLREALGRRAALITVDQGGHGVHVYPLSPDACAAGIATAFLTDGTLPPTDRLCPRGPAGPAVGQSLSS